MGTDDSEKCDVLVVGGGGSGLAAAIESAVAGSRTVLLEKNPALGGSTAWSVGSVTASNTPLSEEPVSKTGRVALAGYGAVPAAMMIVTTHRCAAFFATIFPARSSGSYGSESVFSGRWPNRHIESPGCTPCCLIPAAFIYHLRKRALAVGVDIRLGASVEALKVVDRRRRGVGYAWNGRQQSPGCRCGGLDSR